MDEIFQELLKANKIRALDFQGGFQKGVEKAAMEFAHYFNGLYTPEELARVL